MASTHRIVAGLSSARSTGSGDSNVSGRRLLHIPVLHSQGEMGIKVKIVDIELLTIQIRLLVCSVDKAKEIGVDWWVNHPAFSPHQQEQLSDSVCKLEERLARIETRMPAAGDPG